MQYLQNSNLLLIQEMSLEHVRTIRVPRTPYKRRSSQSGSPGFEIVSFQLVSVINSEQKCKLRESGTHGHAGRPSVIL